MPGILDISNRQLDVVLVSLNCVAPVRCRLLLDHVHEFLACVQLTPLWIGYQKIIQAQNTFLNYVYREIFEQVLEE
jgi:hypothetical protein